MIDFKTNFNLKYVDDMTCRLCGLEEDTFDHLFRCRKYNSKVKEMLDNRFDPKWKIKEETQENINTIAKYALYAL